MTPDAFPGPLFTDLYELTMAAGYFQRQLQASATFSLFIRPHPKRGYFVSAGLEAVLDALDRFRFSTEEIDWLARTGRFKTDFLDYLAALTFTGNVMAMPEGEIFFPNEPLLEISAPLIEAQLLETYLINTMGVASMLATKAARCVYATAGRPIVDFSLRRTQGSHAGMVVARSSYIAGFNGTSNVLAGKQWDIPISGTMAHSFVTAFESEIDAFEAYADLFPESSIFLIDTYDTLQGARNAARVGRRMQAKGLALQGVRLDSGDMVDLSRRVRRILDEAGLPEVKIFASSGFDEYVLSHLIENGARIDAFGVGTRMGVSADAPYLDMVYKMVRLGNRDVRKQSEGKVTLAGEKQVFRRRSPDGRFRGDIIGLRDDVPPDGATAALLAPVMEKGRRLGALPPLSEIRDRFADRFARLDDQFKRLENPGEYPVAVSRRLAEIQKKC
ncbi:nicotinate phosphoribosyltransferase [Desulfosarcina ovata]|uniref:Nicotinate phosphoribosyltransferase n=1 Tax=Desulfosarcina ovata subsp. ovata TaxID=2752305 RepID=A0A5K8AC54_9BACT|nr:nicotinate phosphoribosyltransferase [Desulfosarcina ovata]BBO90079.1 nicotinate phosphoribosyltransferase [Desulfosarcina ovata subsp. ovata]